MDSEKLSYSSAEYGLIAAEASRLSDFSRRSVVIKAYANSCCLLVGPGSFGKGSTVLLTFIAGFEPESLVSVVSEERLDSKGLCWSKVDLLNPTEKALDQLGRLSPAMSLP